MPHLTLRLTLLLTATLAAPSHAAEVRLRARAAAAGDVTLRDVARLEGEAAEELAGVVVATFAGQAEELTLSLASLRRSLDERGVNWGKVALAGYAQCRVERLTNVPQAPAAEGIHDAAPPLSASEGLPLRRQIEALVGELSGLDAAELKVAFSDHDAAALDGADPADRYELEPQSGTGLGRVPIVVRRWSGQRLVGTLRVTADVARRATGVVAVRPVSRGETITAGDVELREVLLDGVATPIPELARVVGQDAAASLREGTVVLPQHVRSPLLVQRGELVTVRVLSGALVIKTVGRAVDAGTMDQVIGVRNERTRETFYARVSGAQEAVVVPADDTRPAGQGSTASAAHGGQGGGR